MRFDLVDLQLFIAVADQRSITRGAERSHLALASASARIKGLEDALGVALLKRGRRGVELTAAGESLLDHARLVIHQIDAMRGDLAGFASGVRASVPGTADLVLSQSATTIPIAPGGAIKYALAAVLGNDEGSVMRRIGKIL